MFVNTSRFIKTIAGQGLARFFGLPKMKENTPGWGCKSRFGLFLEGWKIMY